MSAEFGNLLRKAREEKGLSQTELAEKTGLQPSAISHFELGRRSPSFDNLRILADALAVTVDYLLGRESDSHSAGPTAQQLFRNFEQLTHSDQEVVADFAQMLAEKNRQRHGGS